MPSLSEFEKKYVRPKQGRTLIVGSQVYNEKEDRRRRYHDAVGVDMLAGPGVDVVVDLEEGYAPGMFDHVECMSVLEHSRRPWLLAQSIEHCMNQGATIFVSVPFVWRPHGYPSDYWRMTKEALPVLFPGVEWERLMYAGHELQKGDRLEREVKRGHPYFARTETVGFGYRK